MAPQELPAAPALGRRRLPVLLLLPLPAPVQAQRRLLASLLLRLPALWHLSSLFLTLPAALQPLPAPARRLSVLLLLLLRSASLVQKARPPWWKGLLHAIADLVALLGWGKSGAERRATGSDHHTRM